MLPPPSSTLEIFFENFDLDVLLRRALTIGVPRPLALFCTNVYRGQRILRMEGIYRVCGYAPKGLPAGDVLSFFWVCVYSMPGLDYILYSCPGIQLDVYMDDLAATVHGSPTGLPELAAEAT